MPIVLPIELISTEKDRYDVARIIGETINQGYCSGIPYHAGNSFGLDFEGNWFLDFSVDTPTHVEIRHRCNDPKNKIAADGLSMWIAYKMGGTYSEVKMS